MHKEADNGEMVPVLEKASLTFIFRRSEAKLQIKGRMVYQRLNLCQLWFR